MPKENETVRARARKFVSTMSWEFTPEEKKRLEEYMEKPLERVIKKEEK